MKYVFDCETNGFLEQTSVLHSLVLRDVEQGFIYSCHDHPVNDAPMQVGNIFYLDIESGLKLLMEAEKCIGHNIIKFDIPAIQKIYPWFNLRKDQIIDTLVISRLIWSDMKDLDFKFRKKNQDFPGKLIGRHSLEAWGHRLRLHKGDYAKEMAAKGLDPWAAWNLGMQAYCELDVEVTYQLYRKIVSRNYSQDAINLEHDFQHWIWLQEQHGFPFNEDEAWKLYATLVGRRSELEEELRQVFKPWFSFAGKMVPKRSQRRFVENPHGKLHWRGPKKDRVQVRGYYEEITEGAIYGKIKLTTFNPGSRDHISNRLMTIYGWEPQEFGDDGKPTVDDEVLGALQYPEAKLLSEYLMVQKRIGQLAEGKQACLKLVKPDGRIHGNVITNGAVTGRCTHNSPNVAQTPAIGVPYGTAFRSLYYVPEGWSLVGADASGLELRCLAHYMARYDSGAYGQVILEGDIHTVNQQAAGLPTRANAKTFIYGFLYGAGDAKIGLIVGKGAKAGRELKKKFLDRTPALKRLREAVLNAVKEKGFLKGLDGRYLHIRSSHAALNTLLQSAGALAVKQATVFLCEELSTRGYVFGKDWVMVAHVHDEVQIMCRTEIAEEVGNVAIESFRKAGEHFGFRCPLDGEFKIGRNWAETH